VRPLPWWRLLVGQAHILIAAFRDEIFGILPLGESGDQLAALSITKILRAALAMTTSASLCCDGWVMSPPPSRQRLYFGRRGCMRF